MSISIEQNLRIYTEISLKTKQERKGRKRKEKERKQRKGNCFDTIFSIYFGDIICTNL